MTTTARVTDRRTAIVLGVLFAGSFVMGCAEMLVVGLLDLIAADLAVSVTAAGSLVTANALGLAIGGPLLTFLTIRLDRRMVLLGTLVIFIVANALPALIADYPMFMIARVLIGAAQGLFIAAAIVTATGVMPPERAGRGMAVVISGFATSSAFGLPVGTLLGQAVGWRGAFAAVVAVGAVVLLLAFVVLPAVPTPREGGATGQARHAFAPRVLAVLALEVLVFAAIFSAITYLVPYVDQVTGISGPLVSAFLLVYGVATAIGSLLGGRFADSNAARSLIVGAVGVAASLLALSLLGGNALFAWVAVFALGLFGMGAAPSMQHRVVGLAGPGAPLAAALPASAVNAGIAFGALAGGTAIETAGIPASVVTGAVLAAVAVAVAWATKSLRPPTGRATTTSAVPAEPAAID